MSHPSLGRPPSDASAGFPEAAATIRRSAGRLAARALEIAIADDPTLRRRYDEAGLRRLLHDAEVMIDRIALSLATVEPELTRTWADAVAPIYRRRSVPMDDLVALAEGARRAMAAALAPGELGVVDASVDAAIATFRWHRRLAGDARKRNRLLALLYKGA